MKNTYTKLLLVAVTATLFSSCLEARRSTTCPSHDPYYFRTYPYTSARKRKLVAVNEETPPLNSRITGNVAGYTLG